MQIKLSNLILNLYVLVCAGSFSHHAVDTPSLCGYYNLYGSKLALGQPGSYYYSSVPLILTVLGRDWSTVVELTKTQGANLETEGLLLSFKTRILKIVHFWGGTLLVFLKLKIKWVKQASNNARKYQE